MTVSSDWDHLDRMDTVIRSPQTIQRKRLPQIKYLWQSFLLLYILTRDKSYDYNRKHMLRNEMQEVRSCRQVINSPKKRSLPRP